MPLFKPNISVFRVALAVLIAATALGAAEKPRFLTPEESLAALQLEPGLRIDLVASEPLIADPVAFAFDEKQRLYVVENRGYPDPLNGKPFTHEGRVALLEDTDGDGRYDRRREFAAGLTYPNGIVVWRGGVFVTCAPDILYLKDNDGDGIADERRVVLTGFMATKTAQIRVSAPTLGWDGKIYLACGSNGGIVTSPEHPERAAVDFTASPADGRFDPVTLVYEKVGGRNQFGLTFDAFGRRFGATNRHPVLHTVLEPPLLARNPHLAFNLTAQEVSKVQHEAKVFPISRSTVTTYWADIFQPKADRISHSGTVTSACSPLVFNGSGLAPQHVGNVFFCEPAQNLVQRQVFQPAGASFRSATPYSGREFLASTDIGFRPVFMGNGPDGALYIADMYRTEIDHPQYVPEEARPRMDFEGGKGAGRIYRVAKERWRAPAPVGNTVLALARDLESADAWRRETAQRMLLERADPAAVPFLEKSVTDATLAASRVRALWTLYGLQRLSPAMAGRAMSDPDPSVREWAIQLAGRLPAEATDPLKQLVAAAGDSVARVRFVAALVLGSHEGAGVVDALAAIAVRDGEDRWARAAVLSGIGSRLEEFTRALERTRALNPAGYALVMEDLARIYGGGASLESCQRFITQMLADDRELTWCLPAVLGLIEGTRGRADFKQGGPAALFAGASTGPSANSGDVFQQLARMAGFPRLAKLAGDDRLPVRQRVSAVTLLGYGSFDDAGGVLGELLDPRRDAALQLQAVRALERMGATRGAELLVRTDHWTKYTPKIRTAVVAALCSKPAMIEVLFNAMQQGTIPAAAISADRRERLLKHNSPEIRRHAEANFQKMGGGDRMKVYQGLREIVNLPGEAKRGGEVFVRTCSACHTYAGAGGKVGPDLTGVRNQTAETLLLHIIVPNHEITPGYETVTVTTRDGTTIAGRIIAESDNGLTLRSAIDTEEIVTRANIASFTASNVSLMPDGLEQTMTKGEIANLIAYLRQDFAPAETTR